MCFNEILNENYLSVLQTTFLILKIGIQTKQYTQTISWHKFYLLFACST